MTPLLEGFSMGEAHLLTVIVCREKENRIKVSEVAERMGVSSPAVSRMLKKLEEQGMIERVTDKEDRRSVCVTPTEQGSELAGRIKENLQDFAGCVLSQMNEEDYERVIIFFRELYDASEKKLAQIRTQGRAAYKAAPKSASDTKMKKGDKTNE